MRGFFVGLFASFLSVPAAAQVMGGRLLVATELPGPMTRLLEVDTTTGTTAPLGGFPSDAHRPLRVTIDPIDLDVLVAVELAGGASRVVRLRLAGLAPIAERTLADLPGAVTDLSVLQYGDAFATIAGPQSGVWRVPRAGGPPSLVAPFARPIALQGLGLGADSVLVGETGASGPPVVDPRITWLDLATGVANPPMGFPGTQPPEITDLFELPTAVPRTLLAHPDGTVSFSEFYGTPTPILVTPALPPGGAVTIEPDAGMSPRVLGGQAHPFVKTFQVFPPTASPTWTILAGPFPGNPVDMASAPGGVADTFFFGQPCGHAGAPMSVATSGVPALGNPAWGLHLVQAIPNTPATLGIGASDWVALGAIPLPFALQNGCTWWVDPAVVLTLGTNAFGSASLVFAIPNDPALAGAILFAQWVQAQAGSVAVTPAVAIHVG